MRLGETRLLAAAGRIAVVFGTNAAKQGSATRDALFRGVLESGIRQFYRR